MDFDTTCKIQYTSSSNSNITNSSISSSAQSTQKTETHPEDQKKTKTKNKKLPSSKYKGVVAQSNGRWGAQLYNGHKRVWLGTFDSQDQAAEAHDLAAIRFRGVHAAANFSARHYSGPHLEFLKSHSMAQLVGMLRCHTYHDELARFVRAHLSSSATGDKGVGRERLFEKVLTSSDVGKGTLHRLVIPKFHAERDLPALDFKGKEGKMLTFEDIGEGQRLWRFKYCYWEGSKNYVFTKGWSHFVKVKGLKTGDFVTFYSSTDQGFGQKRLYIESTSSLGSNSNSMSSLVLQSSSTGKGADRPSSYGSYNGGTDGSTTHPAGQTSLKMLRLFGFDVCPIQ